MATAVENKTRKKNHFIDTANDAHQIVFITHFDRFVGFERNKKINTKIQCYIYF